MRRKGTMADRFEHYLYVLRCADGSLYTGYTTDVAARVAAHAAGRGAKYTRAHGPVELVASARFFTKERAMSAEYRFKRLTRARKDALIAAASARPFEEVLASELPGFGEEPVGEFVAHGLCAARDETYRAFMAPLAPSVPANRMVGVRTPQLRSLARKLAARDDADAFFAAVPHRLFEENQLHAFAIARIRDYGERLTAYEAFLPFVNNWATCDQLPTKPLMEQPETALARALSWMASGEPYMARFGMRVLMAGFLKERFEPRFLEAVANVQAPKGEGGNAGEDGYAPEPPSPGYYVNMMRAWFFAEALAAQPDAALPWLKRCAQAGALDEWTRHKAIRKALESRRIPPETKECLRALP